MRCVADVASTHQFAAYTQYVCSAKVAADSGRCTSHILMVSSQDPLRNRLRCVMFQLSEYTYSAEILLMQRPLIFTHLITTVDCLESDAHAT